MFNELTLSMFGFGCVGQGLFDVLHRSEVFKTKINRICVLQKEKTRTLDSSFFVFDSDLILSDVKENIIVELINDPEAALNIVLRSLQTNRNVVSANKKMIAENFQELFETQIETGCSLLYEGAVGGSIPVIRTLEEYYDNEPIRKVRGILNGSSNFILTKMFEENLSFDTALKIAQDNGFAEANPFLDVSGLDSKYKLCIVCIHAYGIILQPEDFLNFGISGINEFDLDFAKQSGFTIKQIVSAERSLGGYRIFTMPTFIRTDNELSGIKNEFNAIEITGDFSGKQLYAGKGAGSHPTGSAVLSDISALSYGYKYGYKKLRENLNSEKRKPEQFSELIEKDFSLKVYIRFSDERSLCELDIIETLVKYSSRDNNYIIARVSYRSLFEQSNHNDTSLFIAALE